MQVFKILPGSKVTTMGKKLGMPLTLARDGNPYFLVCLDAEKSAELERQVEILKQPDTEVFSYILNYGFNSMQTIKKLLESVHGA